MTKLQRMGLAAFVAGMLSVVLIGGTWLLTDSIWLRCVAGLASICAGYLAYEFGDVLRAVPKALAASKVAWDVLRADMRRSAGVSLEKVQEFAHRPHPFLYFAATVSALFCAYLVNTDVHNYSSFPPPSFISLGTYVQVVIAAWIVVTLVLSLMFYMLAYTGARVYEKKLWEGQENALEQEVFQRENLTIVPLTYRDAYRWLMKGCFWIFLSVPWAFICTMVKLIHSSERMMIAVDGPGGGLIAIGCFWLYNYLTGSTSATVLDYGLVVLFGGIFAAATVVVNVRYVAPRFGFNYLAR